MAKMVFTWLLCAQRPLKCRELTASIAVDSKGLPIDSTNDDILGVCCNIVILDTELDIFCFAHLSMHKYLEGREDYSASKMHVIVLDRCLDTYLNQTRRVPLQPLAVEHNESLLPSSAIYWPAHYRLLDENELAEDNKGKMIRFLFDRLGARTAFQY
jgi:hypothetical protein